MKSTPSVMPFILGQGGAGQAIARALATLSVTDSKLGIGPAIWLPRGSDLALPANLPEATIPILCVANPHALHTPAILAGAAAGYRMIFCEKPSCVSLGQVAELESVSVPTAVFHGYRQMWGPQTLKTLVDSQELGDLIAIEGRYWQSSAAARALASDSVAKGWKGDPSLAGNYDVFLDLGTHWADLAAFLYGATPTDVQGWRSYANSDGPTRETHVQLTMNFPRAGRAFASISKTVHGSTNGLELHLIGTNKSATWNFLSPDEILIGTGRNRGTVVRKSSELGSRLPAFHGLGWLEGYIEILREGLREFRPGKSANAGLGNYPRLSENLPLMRALLGITWT